MLKDSKYAMKVHYKHCGKWKWTKWVSNCISATYNNIKFEKSDVIGKVCIRIY
ncbi:MAG: hypothetical protein MJ203_05980 [archaeon]|nr:hypothetical protein [archaeon]